MQTQQANKQQASRWQESRTAITNMTPSGKEIKDTMGIAELVKPLNTRVGCRVRHDKSITKVPKTRGGRAGMCAEASQEGT